MAGSFHPLSKAERSQIHDTRLRVIAARRGETLAELVERSGGVWTPARTAVANALGPRGPLAGGELVKVPIREPYAE